MNKPLLLLDIDGVLAPFGDGPPEGYDSYVDLVWLSAANAVHLQLLARKFKLVWATAWEHTANVAIAPWHGLGQLPYIEFTQAKPYAGGTWKLPDIKDYVKDRPFAWIDDDIREDAFDWAKARPVPTLLIKTDHEKGFTQDAFDELDSFGQTLQTARKST